MIQVIEGLNEIMGIDKAIEQALFDEALQHGEQRGSTCSTE